MFVAVKYINKMVTEDDLRYLGFKKVQNPYKKFAEYFTLGEETIDFCGPYWKAPLIEYDIDTQICRTARGEFCTVSRKCETELEIKLFINAVTFLFNLKL